MDGMIDLGDERRWQAVLERDREWDGRFVFSVRTTGVFCRASCPARRPKRENALFHDSAEEARGLGLRACLRCRPDEPAGTRDRSRLKAACDLIEASETLPSLATLAAVARVSPRHFHALFRTAFGVTPRAYAASSRARRLRRSLPASSSVLDGAFEAGFGAASRVYANSDRTLGMSPGRWRRGGAGEGVAVAVAPCTLGLVLVAATARGICAIMLGDDEAALRAELRAMLPAAALQEGDDAFGRLVSRVVALADGHDGERLPLDLRGTAFETRVWQALLEIPSGEIVDYGSLAAAIGVPGAARAVGRACGANRVALAVPCHRVVRQDGETGGYRWGVARKALLLARERGG